LEESDGLLVIGDEWPEDCDVLPLPGFRPPNVRMAARRIMAQARLRGARRMKWRKAAESLAFMSSGRRMQDIAAAARMAMATFSQTPIGVGAGRTNTVTHVMTPSTGMRNSQGNGMDS